METRTLVVSADEHVVEPPEFWDEFLPATLSAADRDRAPRLKGLGIAVDGPQSEIGRAFRLFPDLVTYSDRCRRAPATCSGRVAVWTGEGIDVAVVFPQRAMSMWAMADRDLMIRCFDAYNQWLAQLCAGGRGAAARRPHPAHRLSAGAHRGLSGAARGPRLSHRDAAQLPQRRELRRAGHGADVVGHRRRRSPPQLPYQRGARRQRSRRPRAPIWPCRSSRSASCGPIWSSPASSSAIPACGSCSPKAGSAGSLRRWTTPTGSTATSPSISSPAAPTAPSEYWHRQCYATFMEDQRGVEQLDFIGGRPGPVVERLPPPGGDATDARASSWTPSGRPSATSDFADIVGGNAARCTGSTQVPTPT